MSPLFKNILIALAAAAALWFGYRYFFAGDGAALEVFDAGALSPAAQETEQFLRELRALRTVSLSGDFFTDERFRSLVDFREEITPEPAGRVNPFASFGE